MHQKPCPNCGYCPCCGRANGSYKWPPPTIYPYQGPYWYTTGGTTTSTTFTIPNKVDTTSDSQDSK